MYILAPSILAADFSRLGEEVRTVADAGAEYIHLDVMDGAFVPSISFGMPVIQKLRPVTDKVFDVHMMVEEPGRYVADIKKGRSRSDLRPPGGLPPSGPDSEPDPGVRLQGGCGSEPGDTGGDLSCVLKEADMFLIMSVNPGFGGQKFIPYTLEKIRKLRAMLNEAGLSTDIQVDGGISAATCGTFWMREPT